MTTKEFQGKCIIEETPTSALGDIVTNHQNSCTQNKCHSKQAPSSAVTSRKPPLKKIPCNVTPASKSRTIFNIIISELFTFHIPIVAETKAYLKAAQNSLQSIEASCILPRFFCFVFNTFKLYSWKF